MESFNNTKFMNANIESLYKIAQKPSRIIVGLMSGTSMDGLDVALCKVSGSGENTKIELLHFDTLGFSNEIKIEIQKVFAKKNIDFQSLVLLNEWIGNPISDEFKISFDYE